jgi:phage terminase small subunit
MGAGRPRKPDYLKVMHGTYRHDRDGMPCPPVEMSGTPEKPQDMSQAASEFWDQYIPALVAKGVVSNVDGPELSLMCRYWAESIKAHVLCDATPADNEHYYRNLQLCIMADNKFTGLADKFGLNPLDRSRLRVKTPEETKSTKIKPRERTA